MRPPTARSSPAGKGRAGSGFMPRDVPLMPARHPPKAEIGAALAREALRIGELDGARPDLTLQVTGLEAGEGLNTVPSSGSLRPTSARGRTMTSTWALGQRSHLPRLRGNRVRDEDLGGRRRSSGLRPWRGWRSQAIALGTALGNEFGGGRRGRRVRRLVDGEPRHPDARRPRPDRRRRPLAGRVCQYGELRSALRRDRRPRGRDRRRAARLSRPRPRPGASRALPRRRARRAGRALFRTLLPRTPVLPRQGSCPLRAGT